ncbi:hypothetical protein ACLOJK_034282 [Asimina triloba]
MELDPSKWPRSQYQKGVLEVQLEDLGNGMSRNSSVEKCRGSNVIGLRGSVRSKNGISVCGGGCGVGCGVCLGLGR